MLNDVAQILGEQGPLADQIDQFSVREQAQVQVKPLPTWFLHYVPVKK